MNYFNTNPEAKPGPVEKSIEAEADLSESGQGTPYTDEAQAIFLDADGVPISDEDLYGDPGPLSAEDLFDSYGGDE